MPWPACDGGHGSRRGGALLYSLAHDVQHHLADVSVRLHVIVARLWNARERQYRFGKVLLHQSQDLGHEGTAIRV